MSASTIKKVDLTEVVSNRRRGGDVRTLLTPATVGSTSGFMGVAMIEPGEYITEHYHPYSEEFLHLVRGLLVVRVDGEPVELEPGQSLMLPRNTRHRLENPGRVSVYAVFHLSPLAPRPELGHVDTEALVNPGAPVPGHAPGAVAR